MYHILSVWLLIHLIIQNLPKWTEINAMFVASSRSQYVVGHNSRDTPWSIINPPCMPSLWLLFYYSKTYHLLMSSMPRPQSIYVIWMKVIFGIVKIIALKMCWITCSKYKPSLMTAACSVTKVTRKSTDFRAGHMPVAIAFVSICNLEIWCVPFSPGEAA